MITWKKVNLFTQNLKSQYFSKIGSLENLMMVQLVKTASHSTTRNGTILIFENWESGEPNDGATRQNCVAFYNKKWYDLNCAGTARFICEKYPN